MTIHEKRSRSIVKAFSYRFLGTGVTFFTVFILTGKVAVSFAVGGVEVFSKILLHYFHERAWNRLRWGRREFKPAVIWLTGLSGAGKTTLATQICERLKEKGLRVEHLDGDKLRSLFPNTGFSRSERDQHVRRVGHLASMLEKNGVFVVASLISPYAESREFVRNLCQNYIEIYVSTPLDVCEVRDVKGHYAKARRKELNEFTGISDPYEVPKDPRIVIDTKCQTISESLSSVMEKLAPLLRPEGI